MAWLLFSAVKGARKLQDEASRITEHGAKPIISISPTSLDTVEPYYSYFLSKNFELMLENFKILVYPKVNISHFIFKAQL